MLQECLWCMVNDVGRVTSWSLLKYTICDVRLYLEEALLTCCSPETNEVCLVTLTKCLDREKVQCIVTLTSS